MDGARLFRGRDWVIFSLIKGRGRGQSSYILQQMETKCEQNSGAPLSRLCLGTPSRHTPVKIHLVPQNAPGIKGSTSNNFGKHIGNTRTHPSGDL